MERAGFWLRLGAFLLDTFLIAFPVTLLWSLYQGEWSYQLTEGWGWDIIYTCYLTIIPVLWGGYVVGKRIFTIRIRKEGDRPVTLLQMFVREVVGKFLLGYLTFGITTLISAAMIGVLKDRKAIHDYLAQTYVKNEV
ncbi:RDD family protein [Halobacillus litoralis]|uniref:RDD family protein n=1 Tax=Halobacillus litoralis TaxID=45668 RepID=UPI0013E8C30C|nr:RDD family protein [Halobacillus litoralis]